MQANRGFQAFGCLCIGLVTVQRAAAGITVSLVPVGGTSIAGGEEVTLEIYVQSDVDQLLIGGQVDLPCVIDNGTGILDDTQMFVGTPSLGGVPWLCPGGIAAANQISCYAAQSRPIGAAACPLLPAGETRYLVSITYAVSACVEGNFDIGFETMSSPPQDNDITKFRDQDHVLVPVVGANGTTLAPGSEGRGSCCDDLSCLADDTYASCCAQTHPGAQFYLGKSCGDPEPCRGPCCLSDGSCADLDGVECANQGGTSLSDATACSATEACCLGGGACAMLDPACCLTGGGTPLGAGSSCDVPMACCNPSPPRQIFWTEVGVSPGRVVSAGLDGSSPDNVAVDSYMRGVAVDVVEQKVYWCAGTRIRRANLDGSGAEDLLNPGSGSPRHLALDGPNRKIYWTDGATMKVRRANLDGTETEDLVVGLGLPAGIALNATGGKMYWADFVTAKIQSAALDGTGVQDLITGRLGRLEGLVLDASGGKLYWTEGLTQDAGPGVYRANLDGSGIESLVTPAASAFGIGLDVSAGKMYWASGAIQRANLDGSEVETLVSQVNQPHGIALALPVRYGDLDENGFIDVGDVLCVLAGFANPGACLNGDISPCGGDGERDVGDVLLILDLYRY